MNALSHRLAAVLRMTAESFGFIAAHPDAQRRGPLGDNIRQVLAEYDQECAEQPDQNVDSMADAYMVVLGNPVDGFTYYGPFDDMLEAEQWADKQQRSSDWWLAELRSAE